MAGSVEVDWVQLESGPWLLLIHGTFSTPQAAFHGWVGSEPFKATMQRSGGRCVAVAHPSLSASPDDNADWTLKQLPSAINGPVDVVCHRRGGLVARRLTVTNRLKMRRVCLVGTPNEGTPLAHAKNLIAFLDGHTAFLTDLPDTVSTILLEGILFVVKLVGTGVGEGLPGLFAMEPDGDYLKELRQRTLNAQYWFTVGADYQPGAFLSSRFLHRAADAVVDGFFGLANDLVVPSAGCHLPGPPVADSLRLQGGDVHHCNYFSSTLVHESADSVAHYIARNHGHGNSQTEIDRHRRGPASVHQYGKRSRRDRRISPQFRCAVVGPGARASGVEPGAAGRRCRSTGDLRPA